MFINTLVVGSINAPLYRMRDHYLVVVYKRNARGVFTEVDRHKGTRRSVVASRNISVTTNNS